MSALCALASCSTQKNTAMTRSFHSTKVKYNIYYNGDLAYQEGLEAIAQAHEDNFAEILPLYPVSDHKAAEASKAKMDRTIEKCRKCIKLHSIKKRPKVNQKKMSDPKYKAWTKQEEFNPSMPLAWIRLGQAEFHKGDFLGAISTFNYIQRHFGYDKDLVAQCQLWSVRAFAEMGWLYEAEDLLMKVAIDDLNKKHANLYSVVCADLYLKQERYREALPHVLKAKQDEDRKTSRPRFEYVLGQLYEQQNQRQEAYNAYKRVIKLTPAWALDFNARLRITQLDGNSSSALKALDKMIKRDKYKDYLDQLYGAKGSVYLQQHDTAKALEQYALGIEKSVKNGGEKAALLVRAADIYFDRRDYDKAQPYYSEAVTIISSEDADYPRLRKRAEVLEELVQYTGTVTLQDSLQRLSKLSDEEQLAVVEQIILDLMEKEKQDSIAAAQAARDEANGKGSPRSVNTSNMIGGGGGAGEWYFYNANLMRQGKQAFRQKWGSRKLEDNWRRMIHSQPSFADETDGNDDDRGEGLQTDSLTGDSVQAQRPVVTDIHDPQYYLQQIPRTEAELQQSDTMIADALYNMVLVYQDRLENDALAEETLTELKTRYPGSSHLPDLYYMQYLTALKKEDTEAAALYRNLIMQQYPTSAYAKVVSDPDYFNKLRTAEAAGDSLYESAYTAFRKSDYQTVREAVKTAETDYPLSPLLPRFLFLQSVADAKTVGQDKFIDDLRDLVARYPESETGAMAKDMLAMMNQGLESQKGGSNSSLADKRQQQMEEEMQQPDSTELKEKRPEVVITLEKNEQMLNRLLYEVALYNFSQFMIKDFDLETRLNYSVTESALVVLGFETDADADWYKGLLRENQEIMNKLHQMGAVIQ